MVCTIMLHHSKIFYVDWSYFRYSKQLAIPYLGCLFNLTVMSDYKCKWCRSLDPWFSTFWGNLLISVVTFPRSWRGRGGDADAGVTLDSGHVITTTSAANRSIGEVVQSQRRPLLGTSPGWKRLLALSHLRHYAKRALTPRSLNVKLGPRRNYHKGRPGWLA